MTAYYYRLQARSQPCNLLHSHSGETGALSRFALYLGTATMNDLTTAYKHLLSRTDDPDDLHDAVVDVIPRLAVINDVAAYLARAAFHRRLKRRKSEVGAIHQLEPEWIPRDILEQEELSNAVSAAVQRLPARQRAVAELACYQGMRCPAISRALGLPIGKVRNLHYRARYRLAHSLQWAKDSSPSYRPDVVSGYRYDFHLELSSGGVSGVD